MPFALILQVSVGLRIVTPDPTNFCASAVAVWLSVTLTWACTGENKNKKFIVAHANHICCKNFRE
jgi:hypothetical protein